MCTRPLPPVFTTSTAHEAGWTPDALRHAARTGRLIRLRHGVYTTVSEPGPIEYAIAAALAQPSAVISHRSAALMHGLPLVGQLPPVPDLTVGPRQPVAEVSVHSYRASLRPEDVVEIDAVAVTSVARTVVDVARHRGVATAVALADAALNREAVTGDDLSDQLRFHSVWPGIARARRALRLADPSSESPLESVSRLVLRRAPLPRPVLQQNIRDLAGRFVGRADFYWDEFGVVGEADGASKYDTRAVLVAEKQRQERLERLGLVVTRWGWSEAWSRPHVLVDRVGAALELGRLRTTSGFPRKWVLSDR